MANPSYIDSSRSYVSNTCATAASNIQASAFAIQQSPTTQKIVVEIKKFAPTVIAMVGTYYAPARVTFFAFGFTCFLRNNKAIELKTVAYVAAGIAIGILLVKGFVITVAAIASIGVAELYLQNKKAQHSAERKEEIEWNNKPKVEDVTDEVSAHEVSGNEDNSGEVSNSTKPRQTIPLTDDSVVTERKLPKLHINSSDTEDETSTSDTSDEDSLNYYYMLKFTSDTKEEEVSMNEASGNQDISDEAISQEETQ